MGYVVKHEKQCILLCLNEVYGVVFAKTVQQTKTKCDFRSSVILAVFLNSSTYLDDVPPDYISD